MRRLKILQKRIGYANVTLVQYGTNTILVDTGVNGKLKQLELLCKQAGISLADLKLIILTHTHFDHAGNLKELNQQSAAPVLVHQKEFENLQKGFTPVPQGNGKYSKIISKIGRTFAPRYASPRPFTAQLINHDEFDLSPYGIPGKVISTPGHTIGSQSVLVGKNLIAGDCFLNLKSGRIFPPFSDYPYTLLNTWQQLFSMEIEWVYPGHGKRFRIENAYPDYERWNQKLKRIPEE